MAAFAGEPGNSVNRVEIGGFIAKNPETPIIDALPFKRSEAIRWRHRPS